MIRNLHWEYVMDANFYLDSKKLFQEQIIGQNLKRIFLINMSRLVQLKIEDSSSIFLEGMKDSIIPVMVSHGEGRADFNLEEENVIARLC